MSDESSITVRLSEWHYLQNQAHELEALRNRSEWQPVITVPRNQSVLLWWRPKNATVQTYVIGSVSSHEDGKWWNRVAGRYQDIRHITHWMPLPHPPAQEGE